MENTIMQTVAALNLQFGERRALPLAADMSVAGSENTAAAHYREIDILVNNRGAYALSDFFPRPTRTGACLK